MTLVLILAGLALLAIGGDILVRGAVGVSRRLGVSPLLVGLTVVGFGTSTPELTTSLMAAWEGAPGIAVGNVVGSNIANILLILGISALILPLTINPAAFRRDGLALAVSTLACLAAVLVGALNRPVGMVLIMLLAGYVLWAFRAERRTATPEAEMHEHVAADVQTGTMGLATGLFLSIAGIAATIFGARLLVDGAIDISRDLGVSETVIGLTVVAVGTSLPELVACIVAAIRRHADVALGNIIGSNIYNVLGILGVTALIQPIDVPAQIAALDIWVLVGVTGLLFLFLRTGWTLRRWEAAIFLALYAGYVATMIM